MNQINIEDVKNYKKTSKKQYEVYACIPQRGTLIINKLEQAELYNRLGKKDHFTAEQVQKQNLLQKYTNEIKSGKIRMANGSDICIVGTVGEMKLINFDIIYSSYTFADGNLINPDSLKKEWRVLKTKGNNNYTLEFACFIPKSQKGFVQTYRGIMEYNGAGVDHGKGDFIVCASTPDCRPNLQSKVVVNGNAFATTYKNTGFTDNIGTVGKFDRISINTLPKIYGLPATEQKAYMLPFEVFNQKCDTFMKNLQALCKFKVTFKRSNTMDVYKNKYDESIVIPNAYVNEYVIQGFAMNEMGGSLESYFDFVCNKEDKDCAINIILSTCTGPDELYFNAIPAGLVKLDKQKGYYVCVDNIKLQSLNCAEEAKCFTKLLPKQYAPWITNTTGHVIDDNPEEYIESAVNVIPSMINLLNKCVLEYNHTDSNSKYMDSFLQLKALPNCFLTKDYYDTGLNTDYASAVVSLNAIKVFFLALKTSLETSRNIRNTFCSSCVHFDYQENDGALYIRSNSMCASTLFAISVYEGNVIVTVNDDKQTTLTKKELNIFDILEQHRKAATSKTSSDTVYKELRQTALYKHFLQLLDSCCNLKFNDGMLDVALSNIALDLESWLRVEGFNILNVFEMGDTKHMGRIVLEDNITLHLGLDVEKSKGTINFVLSRNGYRPLRKEVINTEVGNYALLSLAEPFSDKYPNIWESAMKTFELKPSK